MNQHAWGLRENPVHILSVVVVTTYIARPSAGILTKHYWPNYSELQYDCVWNSMYAHRKFNFSRVGVNTFSNTDNLKQRCRSYPYVMMTSSNGNIYRVTGPSWRNPSVIGGFSSQRPVTRSFDIFFGLRLYKRLSKQSRRRRFETPSCSLWRHRNGTLDDILGSGTNLKWNPFLHFSIVFYRGCIL